MDTEIVARLGTENVCMDAPATAVTIAYIYTHTLPRWSPGDETRKGDGQSFQGTAHSKGFRLEKEKD